MTIKVMRKETFIRGVDDRVYRRAKAVAALKGISLGTAVSEALEEWAVRNREVELEREYLRNIDWARANWKILKRHKGKVVVIAEGRLQGEFENYEKAWEVSGGYDVAIVFRVEEPPAEREVELGPDIQLQQEA